MTDRSSELRGSVPRAPPELNQSLYGLLVWNAKFGARNRSAAPMLKPTRCLRWAVLRLASIASSELRAWVLVSSAAECWRASSTT